MILIWRDVGKFIVGRLRNYMELTDAGFRPAGGVTVPQPFPTTTLDIDTAGDLPDFFFAGPVFIASDAL